MVGLRKIIRLVRRFAADRRGNAAMLFGLALMPLVAGAGLAVDSLLAYAAEDRLQKALDAAGLAGGRASSPENIEADARAFFESNFKAGPDLGGRHSFKVEVGEGAERIVLTASAEMRTRFMTLLGRETITVSARTVINREIRQMELALVLDNTGSMAGTPFNTMKAAAHDLINIVYGERETHPNLFVAVVPYVSVVNIGPQRTIWLKTTDRVRTSTNPYAPSRWKGCVMARGDGYDQTDDPPGVRPFDSYLYPSAVDNDWTQHTVDERLSAGDKGRGPNLGCGPAITPLIQEKSDVHAALDQMGAWSRGGTAGNLGLVWSWRTLSPRWQGLWGGDTPADRPLDYDAPNNDKVVVILTDGNNQVYDWNYEWRPGQSSPVKVTSSTNIQTGPEGSDFTGYGRLWTFMSKGATISQGKAELNARMARVCTRMKEKGIIIYGITFGSTPDSSTQKLYRQCASGNEFYFHAPDNATLIKIFHKVGMQLSNLRIAE